MTKAMKGLRLAVRALILVMAAGIVGMEFDERNLLLAFVSHASYGQAFFALALIATVAVPLLLGGLVVCRWRGRREGLLPAAQSVMDAELAACSLLWTAWTAWWFIGGLMTVGGFI